MRADRLLGLGALLSAVAISQVRAEEVRVTPLWGQDGRIGIGEHAERIDALSGQNFAGVGPQIALSRSWNTVHEVTTFHRPWMTQAGVRESVGWFARRVSIDNDNYPALKMQYADGRICPSVERVLILVEQIEKPIIDLPAMPSGNLGDDVGLRAADNIINDDASYALSVSAFFDTSLSPSDLTITGGSNSPVGALIELALSSLEACWSDAEPDLTATPG